MSQLHPPGEDEAQEVEGAAEASQQATAEA